MVLPQLAGLPTKIAGAPPGELKVVDEQITIVINSLDDEIAALEKVEFPVKGHIGRHSLGGGHLSPLLANHHARAHGVTVDTMVDVRKDLTAFRDAVREARTLLRTKDEESAADFERILSRADGLDLGAGAKSEAERTHANDTATDDAEGDKS
ncbi:MAG: hypothetical protein L0H31_14680 [Nocardioidaceae bacterium]|nr:hypothetical protein [Nocardioidaceae bacterium]